MAGNRVNVQADPKFEGKASGISAEDWILQLRNSAKAQDKTDAAAIAYYRAHLLGTARIRFGEEGDDFSRKDWARSDTDEPFWVSSFQNAYFKATTQAESVTDWAKIRQTKEESANDVRGRVNLAILSFWSAVNGERPALIDKDERPTAFKHSTLADEAIKMALAETVKKLAVFAQARVQVDSLRGRVVQIMRQINAAEAAGGEATPFSDAQKLRMFMALDVDAAADNAAEGEMIVDMDKALKEMLVPVIRQQTYDDLLTSTRRALMLKTVQTAFSNPKCREEAYHFLKHPEKDLEAFHTALKQAESAAASKQSGGRQHINALEHADGEDDKPASEEADVDGPSKQKMAEMVAAFRQNKKAGGGVKPAGNGGKAPSKKKEHTNKKCDFCRKMGHIKADCYMLKGINGRKAAEAGSSKVAAAQQQSEN